MPTNNPVLPGDVTLRADAVVTARLLWQLADRLWLFGLPLDQASVDALERLCETVVREWDEDCDRPLVRRGHDLPKSLVKE